MYIFRKPFYCLKLSKQSTRVIDMMRLLQFSHMSARGSQTNAGLDWSWAFAVWNNITVHCAKSTQTFPPIFKTSISFELSLLSNIALHFKRWRNKSKWKFKLTGQFDLSIEWHHNSVMSIAGQIRWVQQFWLCAWHGLDLQRDVWDEADHHSCR